MASLANGTSLCAGKSTATSTPRRAASIRARSNWRLGRKYPCASWIEVRAPRNASRYRRRSRQPPPRFARWTRIGPCGSWRLSRRSSRASRAGSAPDLDGEVGPADGATVDPVLVADVDASHERDALVDEEELAVVALQRPEEEPPPPGLDADRAAGCDQLRLDLAGVLRGAPSVERDAHLDASGSGCGQRRHEALARRVQAEEIHLQLHGLSRLLDGQDHARERLDAAIEQRQVLRVVHRTPHHAGVSGLRPRRSFRTKGDGGPTRRHVQRIEERRRSAVTRSCVARSAKRLYNPACWCALATTVLVLE